MTEIATPCAALCEAKRSWSDPEDSDPSKTVVQKGRLPPKKGFQTSVLRKVAKINSSLWSIWEGHGKFPSFQPQPGEEPQLSHKENKAAPARFGRFSVQPQRQALCGRGECFGRCPLARGGVLLDFRFGVV